MLFEPHQARLTSTAAVLQALVLLTVAGCSGGDPGHNSDGSTAAGASFCGRLEGPDRELIGGAPCVICSEDGCQNNSSEVGSGRFCVPVLSSGYFVFHAPEYKSKGKHYGDVLFPITMSAETFDKNGAQEIGTVVMPTLGQTSTLDPARGGTFSLGAGVMLSIPAGVTTPPPFQKTIEMAVAKVKDEYLHGNLTADHPAGKRPKFTYLFVPDEVSFSVPVSFEISGSGLAQGTGLDIYWVDYKTAKLKLHGEATVTSGDKIVDVKGKGLKLLGWFLFYEK